MTTETPAPVRGRDLWLPVVAVAVLGLALLFPRLGASGLWDPWEPKYAQTAREMAQTGDWLIPHYRHDERLNKPPLTYWLIGASRGVFGDSEAAARLPMALLGVACPALLALAFAIRRRPLEGFLAGAALVTSPQWYLLSRFATPDIPLGASLGIALAAVIALRAEPEAAVTSPRMRTLLLAAIPLGIAAAGMTDWPRGLLLPAWAVVAWCALRQPRIGIPAMVLVAALYHAGQLTYSVALNVASMVLALAAVVWILARAGVSWRRILAGAGGILTLVAPWFIAVWASEIEEFSLMTYKHALNLGESLKHHKGDYDYVLRIATAGAFPWCAAALIGLFRCIGRNADETARLCGGAFLGVLLFFTLAEPKMGHMYLAIQPAIAGLAAIGIVHVLTRRDWTGPVALAALGGLWFVVEDRPSRLLESATVKSNLYGQDLSLPVTIVAVVWGAALLAGWPWSRPRWSVASVLPAAVLCGLLGFRLVPALEASKSFAPLWRTYLTHRVEGQPIAAGLNSTKNTAFYYSDNAVVRVRDMSDLREFLAGPGSKFVVFSKKEFSRIRRAPLGGAWSTLTDDHPSHTLVRFDPR